MLFLWLPFLTNIGEPFPLPCLGAARVVVLVAGEGERDTGRVGLGDDTGSGKGVFLCCDILLNLT